MNTQEPPENRRMALVTGGTGFIGQHLVAALAGGGWGVRVLGRRARPDRLPAPVEYRQADLIGDEALDDAFRDVTHVFHVAGASSSRSSPEEMEAVNVEGTERLLDAADRAGAHRFVYVSTSSVYGKKVPLPQPIREDVEAHPDSGYSESKWQGEQVVWRFGAKGLPVAVLRPVTVYGPGAIKLLASTTLDAAIERFAGFGTLAVAREPVELRMVHVDDVVAALLHLAQAEGAVGRAFNVSAPTYPSSHEVAEAVADELGLELELTDDPDPGLSYDRRTAVRDEMLEAGMRDHILLQRERVRFLKKANPNNRLSLEALRSTGFSPGVTDLPASIRASVRWYGEHGWIL